MKVQKNQQMQLHLIITYETFNFGNAGCRGPAYHKLLFGGVEAERGAWPSLRHTEEVGFEILAVVDTLLRTKNTFYA